MHYATINLWKWINNCIFVKKITCLDENTVFIFCHKMDIICYVNPLASYKINKIITNQYELT